MVLIGCRKSINKTYVALMNYGLLVLLNHRNKTITTKYCLANCKPSLYASAVLGLSKITPTY